MINQETVLTQLHAMAQLYGQKHLYLILDLCELEAPLLPKISHWQPELEYSLLFDMTPEALIKEDGPLLLGLDMSNNNHLELLDSICQTVHLENRLLFLFSSYTLADLSVHFRKALQVKWGKSEGILRFYVPDLFLQVNQVLTDIQKDWFHALVNKWFFLSDEGKWLSYEHPRRETRVQGLNVDGLSFSEGQYDSLLMWAEVYTSRRYFLAELKAADYGGEQALLKQLYELTVQLDGLQVFNQAERIRFYTENLQQISL